jgi:hypothetical protein
MSLTLQAGVKEDDDAIAVSPIITTPKVNTLSD